MPRVTHDHRENIVLTVMKPVYYCEHCKRHRLTKNAIETHEPKCIYNPSRSRCGWHGGAPTFRPPAPADFAPVLKQEMDVDWLREEMDGCPACMLAVVVQAVKAGAAREDLDFDYKSECERFRASEREHDYAW